MIGLSSAVRRQQLQTPDYIVEVSKRRAGDVLPGTEGKQVITGKDMMG